MFAVVGATPEHQPLMAACLAGGRTAAASHLAAAHLWGAQQVTAGGVEITTFDNRDHRLEGVITHRSRLAPGLAITSHQDLPVVVPALAIVQVAEVCHPRLVKSVANDLVKRHWTDFPAILRWIDLVGDRRCQALRGLCLEAVDVGGHYDSPPARDLCRRLVEAGAPAFKVDYQVKTPEGLLLIDIAWPRLRVGVEYNGARDHAANPLARIDDARRRRRLADLGWHILEVDKTMSQEAVVTWILSNLASAAGGGLRCPP